LLDIDETIALTLRKLMEHIHCQAASVFLNNDAGGLTCMATLETTYMGRIEAYTMKPSKFVARKSTTVPL